VAATEVLRSDLLEELPELLDLIFLLVRDRDPGLVQHLVAAEDRRSRAKCERDGIRWTRAHLDAAEVKLGIEDAAAKIGDPDLPQLVPKRGDHVLEQIMSERPRRNLATLGIGDRGGLDGTDPDRQIALTAHLAQQHDRLIRRQLHPDTDDVELVHASHSTPRPGTNAGSLLCLTENLARTAARQLRWAEGTAVVRPDLTSAACRRTDSAASSSAISSAWLQELGL
jgi:hypothetical protein